jgi:hypothetical protein
MLGCWICGEALEFCKHGGKMKINVYYVVEAHQDIRDNRLYKIKATSKKHAESIAAEHFNMIGDSFTAKEARKSHWYGYLRSAEKLNY